MNIAIDHNDKLILENIRKFIKSIKDKIPNNILEKVNQDNTFLIMNIIDDIDFDYLNFLELMFKIEEEYKIKIENFGEINIIEDLLNEIKHL